MAKAEEAMKRCTAHDEPEAGCATCFFTAPRQGAPVVNFTEYAETSIVPIHGVYDVPKGWVVLAILGGQAASPTLDGAIDQYGGIRTWTSGAIPVWQSFLLLGHRS